MKTKKDGAYVRQLHTLFNLGAIRELTDGQLLERFVTGQGEGAELAFAALVERHGAMVARVCRAHLADPNDVQDAFQVTFLILVEKARGLWVRDSIGPWLHRVAMRTAACARAETARRSRLERHAAEIRAERDSERSGDDRELERWLLAEVDRLPERFRVPIVLCDLEGHTCEEAARRMGRPVGTIKSWRARGRERLRQRLARSGMTLATADALGTTMARGRARAEAVGPIPFATVGTATVDLPVRISSLMREVLRLMIRETLRSAALPFVAIVALAFGFGTLVRVAADDARPPSPPPTAREVPAPTEREPLAFARPVQATLPLSLAEAIQMGLDQHEEIRVSERVGQDQSIRIAPVNPRTDLPRFKSQAMAVVRSIEQAYWELAETIAAQRSAEAAVSTIEGVLERETARLQAGRTTKENVAEVGQRLEAARLQVVTRASDSITVERRFRAKVGLRPADGRRIALTSRPVESAVKLDWDASFAKMMEKPDILRQRSLVEALEAAARGGSGSVAKGSDLQALIDRQAESLETLRRDHAHVLSKFFLEADENRLKLDVSSRSRVVGARRLEAHRSDYEEGRITIDRYLDAVTQFANAEAAEARYTMAYNNSLVSLEEAQGTLLESRRIHVDEPATTTSAARSSGEATKQPRSSTSAREPRPDPGSARPSPEAPPPIPPTPALAAAKALDRSPMPTPGRTVSFHFTLGPRSQPYEIRGSLTIAPATPTASAPINDPANR